MSPGPLQCARSMLPYPDDANRSAKHLATMLSRAKLIPAALLKTSEARFCTQVQESVRPIPDRRR